MIKRATKALRQLGEKSRKRGGDSSREQEGTDPAGMTYDEALTHLQQSQAHLDTLSHAFILSLKDSQQVNPICQTKAISFFKSEMRSVWEMTAEKSSQSGVSSKCGPRRPNYSLQ